MAKVKEFFEIQDFERTFQSNLRSAFIVKGVTSSNADYFSVLSLKMLQYKYKNVDTIYNTTQSSSFTYSFSDSLKSIMFPSFMLSSSFKFGSSEIITKTGTESDAGSFDNDPTTNDEFRSYPFDTTANDVESKTRSIVNGAESGETSNVKTYNTTDTHTREDNNLENESSYQVIVENFLNYFIKFSLSMIRTSVTLCDPISDDSTLFELEY